MVSPRSPRPPPRDAIDLHAEAKSVHATPNGAGGASIESESGRQAVLSNRTGWLAP
ncbi:hypothetical protein EMIT0158MI4_100180 [Burkholderia ambifaria]